MPSQERLIEKYDYDFNAGKLLRRRATSQQHPAGSPIGVFNSGYLRCHVDGSPLIGVHRLIWIYHNGAIPSGLLIDHIDKDKLNNRIENLRLVTPAENQRNRSPAAINPSGHLGISWNDLAQQWRAILIVSRERFYVCQHRDKYAALWLLHLARHGIYRPSGMIKRSLVLRRRAAWPMLTSKH